MKDYSKLSKKKKVEIGNIWLKRNEINDLEFKTVRKNRKLYFALVWKKPTTIISTMSETIIGVEESFEQFVKEIQIEYRLDNSPIIE
jgi:hypothetical protein